MTRKPTHPGTVLLEDVMKPLQLTITDAAQMLHRCLASAEKHYLNLLTRKQCLVRKWRSGLPRQPIHLLKAG